MPLLSRSQSARRTQSRAPAYHAAAGGRVPVEILPEEREIASEQPVRTGFFETCSNPRCASGKLKLWRSRTPVFEGGWCCSPACTRAQVELALSREMGLHRAAPEIRSPRIPLGLVMLEQGWISAFELRTALEAQRNAGAGRLGHWLVRQRSASEDLVTRALGLQWSCPVLGVEYYDAQAMTPLLPRLFVDAFGALPLRVSAGGILYLGFEDRPDPVLALVVGRMTGLRVETGLVPEAVFRPAHTGLLAERFPRVSLMEAVSESALADALLKAIDRNRPVGSRLVRVHDCIWFRMWLRPQTGRCPALGAVEDLICSIAVH